MSLSKWQFIKELKELCVKCTELKPSTAKNYAKKLFEKFDGDCISWNSEEKYDKLHDLKDNLGRALNILKKGQIQSNSSVLKLEDVSFVNFTKSLIVIKTKSGQEISYEKKDFEYLQYVFKYRDYYY